MFSQACVKNPVGGMCGGGMHDRGAHVWQGTVRGRGVCMAGGMCGRGCVCGSKDGHCSGRYASYWKAFLLKMVVTWKPN